MAYPYRQTPTFTSPLGSPEDIELNQAILNSLRPTQRSPVGTQTFNQLPQPTWNNGTQFIPVQTINTFIPVPTQQQGRPPLVPPIKTQQTTTTGQPIQPQLQMFNQSPLPQVQTNVNRTFTPTNQTGPLGTQGGRTDINMATQQTYALPAGYIPTILPPQTQPRSPNTISFPQQTFSPMPPMVPPQPTRSPIAMPPMVPPQPTRLPIAMPPMVPPQPTRLPIVPPQPTRLPIVPPQPNQFLTGTTRPVMPYIPPLAVGTNANTAFVPPMSPPTNFPPIQTVNVPLNDFANQRPVSPRSPGRMTEIEEDQMRIAIMASLHEMGGTRNNIPPVMMTPPRSPLLSPRLDGEDDIENDLLQEAIRASIEAAEHARLANFHANQVLNSPPVSPRTQRFQEDRQIREQQDAEYAEGLRIDRERADAAQKAADAAQKAAAAAEEAAKMLQMAKVAEDAKVEALQPPILKFPIETGDLGDILTLRFRLPRGGTITHSFYKDEPLSSLIQQLRFDTKHLGDFILTIPPRTSIDCSPDTPLRECGIENRIMILVNIA
jgi:hypothetical protein